MLDVKFGTSGIRRWITTHLFSSSHPYSSYARGGDLLIGAYNYLDLMPKGRNEESELTGWVRRHDQYER